jgi:hypothetical protein
MAIQPHNINREDGFYFSKSQKPFTHSMHRKGKEKGLSKDKVVTSS